MNSSNSGPARLAKFFGRFFALLFFPVTIPVAVGKNYRGMADRLESLPGIRRGGGMLAGVSVFVYLIIIGGLIGATTGLALGNGERSTDTATNGSTENFTQDTSPDLTPISTSEPDSTSTSSSERPSTTPTNNKNSTSEMASKEYDLLLSDVEEVYPATARKSYDGPYLEFLGGSYDQERESVTLNFSMDSLVSIDRYESAVIRTAGIYVWSHFDSETANPETVTINYLRDGELNATAKIQAEWMRQYIFGNISPNGPAPMSYQTYVQSAIGTLRVKGEKIEFPKMLDSCRKTSSGARFECKNSLRDRMPVRYYLPEKTATGSEFNNVIGNAQPAGSFDSRQERLEYTTKQLEENISGTVSLEGYTAADEDDVWKEVDMRIRDVYLQNETIVVEQYTRSEIGDDSLPLRQNDVVGARYGRLVVNYGAKFMPANGVVIIKHTPDGQKYSKVRVQNYNAVGYINGERSLVKLGLDMEVIKQYQEPGS